MLQAGPLSASSGFSSFNVARYKRGTTSGLPQRKSKPLDKFAKNRIFPPKNKCYELWINYELWCIIVCLCMYQGIDSQYRYNHATQMCAIISYNKNWDTYVHVHDWSQNIKSPPDLLQYPLAWLSLARCQLGLSTPQPGNLPENVKPVKPCQTFERFSCRISETTLRLGWTRLLLSDLSFQGVYVRPRTFPEPNKGIIQRPGYQGLQDLWHRSGNSKKEKWA